MVFHDDELWRADFAKTNREYNEDNLCDFVRFRSWSTEHLLIRCVKKYMPFVRNIYVLLARESQKQAWMDEEGIVVVYHREFIPDKFLPTFNSCAIEMFLHRIPGLSERFIYGNDDMFPLGMLSEQDFFEGNIPCQHHGEKPFPEKPNIFHLSCLSGVNFVAKEFGKKYTATLLKGGHGLTPMLKSTWEYLWKRGGSEIEASVSAFREPRNFNQWICPWWHHHAGNYINRTPKCVYVSTKNSVEEVVKAISDKDAGIVCVNDNEIVKDYMIYGNAVIAEIEKKLK